MAEIKRTFTAARMNKDLDERLVKNGEYRDAMNIQIRTTDGDAAGTVQNIQGNTLVAASYVSQGGILFNPEVTNSRQNKCIGSISDEQANRCYFLMASPEFNVNFKATSTSETIGNDLQALADSGSGISKSAFCCVDSIVEVTADNVASYVVIDFHSFASTRSVISLLGSINTNTLNVGLGTYLPFFRPDASIQLYASNGDELLDVNTKIVTATADTITLNKELPVAITSDSCSFVKIENERVLDFNQKNQITGINIVDEFLFFTDGVSEPKKINIRRSRIGSPRETSGIFALLPISGSLEQTKLILDNQLTGESLAISEIQAGHNDHLLQEHITVIRKAPRTAPNIVMSKTSRGNNVDFTVVTTDLSYLNPFSVGSEAFGLENTTNEFFDLGNLSSAFGALTSMFTISNEVTNNGSFNANLYSIAVGDVLELSSNNSQVGIPPIIRARILEISDDGTTVVLLALTLLGDDITTADINWRVVLELTNPLFEFKFPRFGYRYKYNDGEYSSFSPFSNIAFLPDDYDYEGKRGYNLGMTNQLRQLKITNFLPEESMRPDDIDSVDILYKSTDSPVVYVIKTINRDIDPEWFGSSGVTANEVLITSDMVYKALPSNQILRSFDNVPRFAKAQEIIGNRIVYANYTQGFDANFNPGLSVSLKQRSLIENLSPERSVKSLRSYKVGLVYGDKYGRETPVIAPGDRLISKTSSVGVAIPAKAKRLITDSIYVEKKEAVKSNKLTVKQHWNVDVSSEIIPSWIDYVKFYVKETSGEYYNMLQHRWYNAEDGNIWLAFGSVDRNKIDEQSYLILKKQHGENIFAEEDARYKVLAIASEAPQFVKTTARKIGAMGILTEEVNYNTVDDFEEGLSTRNEFTAIQSNFFQGLALQNIGTSIDALIAADYGVPPPLDNIFVRVKAESRDTNGNIVNTAFTKYRRVVGVSGYVGDVQFSIESPFSQEAFFVNHFITIGDYTDDGTGSTGANNVDNGVKYTFDFRLFVVENKPEFDGRFFVKVAKDALLDKYVLGSLVGEDNFRLSPVKEFHVGYLESVKTNPATTGLQKDYDFGTNTGGFDPYDNWVQENLNGTNLVSDTDNFFVSMQNQIDVFNSFVGNQNDDGYNFMRHTALYWFGWKRNNLYSMFIDAGDAFAVARKENFDFSTFQDEDQDVIDSIIAGNDIFPPSSISDVSGVDDQPVLEEGTEANDGGNFPCEGSRRGFARSGTLTGDFEDHIDRIYFGIFKAKGNFNSNLYYSTNVSTVNNTAVRWLDAAPFSVESDFYFTMTTPGTLFRFKDKPNLVFKVIGQNDANFTPANRSQGVSGTMLNFYDYTPTTKQLIEGGTKNMVHLPLLLNNNVTSTNYSQSLSITLDTYDDVSKRQNFYTTFRKVDLLTGDTTKEALPLEVFDPRGTARHDGTQSIQIEILQSEEIILEKDTVSNNGAVWETEPKENVDLDIYYEASNALPMILNDKNTVDYAPIGSRINVFASDGVTEKTVFHTDTPISSNIDGTENFSQGTLVKTPIKVSKCYDSVIKIVDSAVTSTGVPDNKEIKAGIDVDDIIKFTHPDGTVTSSKVTRHIAADIDSSGLIKAVTDNQNAGYYEIDKFAYNHTVTLPFSNCFTFGNGVESNRVRDDFNAPFIDNGVNASTTFLNYQQENITNGFIFSGIYNSNSSVNNLNEFNMGEKITKEINPSYGSIQALKARDADLITFTEDKVLKVLANKDALFNADGNANLTASDRVLGQAIPYVGDYGISKNPESLVTDQFRMYFTDQERGAVLRLSRDGLTPISNVGMRNYFRDNLPKCKDIVGSFDTVSGEYNVSLKFKPQFQLTDTTVSFNEAGKGWISFKSFVADNGVSMSGEYYTAFDANVYKHHTDVNIDGTSVNRNTFYSGVQQNSLLGTGTFTNSYIDFIFNDVTGSVKNFKAINYEGSQGYQLSINNKSFTDAAGNVANYTDNSFAAITSSYDADAEIKGWKVTSIQTDLQQGKVISFSKKEGKWYGNIVGDFDVSDVSFNDVTVTSDPSELSTQGLGVPSEITYTDSLTGVFNLIIQ